MTPTKEQIREQYLANQLFLLGEKLGHDLEVIDRRANYIVVVNGTGETSKLFLDEAYALRLSETYSPVEGKSLTDLEGELHQVYKDYPEYHADGYHAMVDKFAADPFYKLHAVAKEYLKAPVEYRKAPNELKEGRLRFSSFVAKAEPAAFSYKGYKPRNFQNHPEAQAVFESLAKTATDPYAVLSAIKHVDIFFEKRDEHSLDIARKAIAKVDDIARHTYLVEETKPEPELKLNVVEDTIKDEEIDFKIEEKLTYSALSSFLNESFEHHVHEVLTHLEKHPHELDKLADHVKTIEHIAHHYDHHSVHMAESAEGKAIEHAEGAHRIAVRKLSSGPQLVKIAKRAAVELIAQKLANKPVKKISAKEKNEIVKAIKQKKTVVMKLARKLVPKIRHIEHENHDHSEEFGSAE